MEQKLQDLTTKLEEAFGESIVSVLLYGSAAAGDWQERASDLNILCVLKAVTTSEMKLAEPIFQWWGKLGNVPPVLMTEEELLHSADCFPIEFHDIQERRRVLTGRDVAAALEIDFTYYRAFVERELRSKQIRLRQKSIEFLAQPERLLQLMLDSISTFCALGRHALILGKRPVKWKKQEVLTAISDATGSALRAAHQVLGIRETGQKPPAKEVLAILDEYLRDTGVIAGFVDSMDK
jgi:predicted nucleotidyltransferase